MNRIVAKHKCRLFGFTLLKRDQPGGGILTLIYWKGQR